ncbi:MAG: UDP-N-acetylmuramate--L-alanine ligase [Candidatus Eremiobacteraeota bacterium]|nr:UDP-N-acetylmuramate--L-alanine ligase [Candidatus Eremiobacteraeota bacterium]
MNQPETVHFIGIGGIGMSAIARILLARGQSVSGSDSRESVTTMQLRAAGARVAIGHQAENIGSATTVVASSAIEVDNPEYRAALEAHVPIVKRGEMLARLMAGRRGIAIAGTHGKTTTTAMVATMLLHANLDATMLVGGEVTAMATNARDGGGEWFLTEADESDGSFMSLTPAIGVVTNIENDHIASDADFPELCKAFGRFLDKLPDVGAAIVGADNPYSAALAARARRARTLTFGLSRDADVRAVDVRHVGLGSSFELFEGAERLGTIELRVPGEINVVNALGALATGRVLRIPFGALAEALHAFAGVRRRFEVLASTARMTVVDDYAHHPTAVRATIAAARRYHNGPLVVAFQPHRFTRTAYLADAFADALAGADSVVLTPIYAAAEAPIPGVSERAIGHPLAARGIDVRYASDVESLVPMLLERAPQGALVLMLGAGTITESAARLAQALAPVRAAR